MSIERIQRAAQDVIDMEERATDLFSTKEIRATHRDITMSCVKRLCKILPSIEDSALLMDDTIKRALWIGEDYSLPHVDSFLTIIKREERYHKDLSTFITLINDFIEYGECDEEESATLWRLLPNIKAADLSQKQRDGVVAFVTNKFQ